MKPDGHWPSWAPPPATSRSSGRSSRRSRGSRSGQVPTLGCGRGSASATARVAAIAASVPGPFSTIVVLLRHVGLIPSVRCRQRSPHAKRGRLPMRIDFKKSAKNISPAVEPKVAPHGQGHDRCRALNRRASGGSARACRGGKNGLHRVQPRHWATRAVDPRCLDLRSGGRTSRQVSGHQKQRPTGM
jgi:hypothetical protein